MVSEQARRINVLHYLEQIVRSLVGVGIRIVKDFLIFMQVMPSGPTYLSWTTTNLHFFDVNGVLPVTCEFTGCYGSRETNEYHVIEDIPSCYIG